MRQLFSSISLMTLLCMLILVSCKKEETEAVQPEPITFEQKIQKKLDNIIAKKDGKGLSLAIRMPDGELLRFVSGISHHQVEVKPDMLFSAGSITKMFTAACILQYAEEGLVSLDEPIGKWIQSHDHIDSLISIRQCLNHTSGIYDIVKSQALWDLLLSQPGTSLDMEEMVYTFTENAVFERGTGWGYSNTNYLILRIIMEKVSGKNVFSEYRDRLLTPNGLNNTYTAMYEELPANTAYGWYDLDSDGAYDEMAPEYMKSFYSVAGGGIFSSAEDLVSWIEKLLVDRCVLGQEMMSEMLNMHSPCPDEEMVEAYGLGVLQFCHDDFRDHNMIGHAGNPMGYAAICGYLPDQDAVIALMDNTEDGVCLWVINDILDLVKDYLNE